MLLEPDGTFIRDIDIEELQINTLGDYGRSITLKKDTIIYNNTTAPTIIDISKDEFLELSNAIHMAGLLNISWNVEKECYLGAKYACMRVLFDDGAYYELNVRTQNRPKEYDKIVDILNQFCNGKGI